MTDANDKLPDREFVDRYIGPEIPAPAAAPTPQPAEGMALDTLLADMRRKYLHARDKRTDGTWLDGKPLTHHILEAWIPQIEQAQALLRERDATIQRLTKDNIGLVQSLATAEKRAQCAICDHTLYFESVYRCADCDKLFCHKCSLIHFGKRHDPCYDAAIVQRDATLEQQAERIKQLQRDLDEARGVVQRMEGLARELAAYFVSGNDVPVEWARISRNSDLFILLQRALPDFNYHPFSTRAALAGAKP